MIDYIVLGMLAFVSILLGVVIDSVRNLRNEVREVLKNSEPSLLSPTDDPRRAPDPVELRPRLRTMWGDH